VTSIRTVTRTNRLRSEPFGRYLIYFLNKERKEKLQKSKEIRFILFKKCEQNRFFKTNWTEYYHKEKQTG